MSNVSTQDFFIDQYLVSKTPLKWVYRIPASVRINIDPQVTFKAIPDIQQITEQNIYSEVDSHFDAYLLYTIVTLEFGFTVYVDKKPFKRHLKIG